MIDLNTINKIYLSNGYTDLRIGIDGLASHVKCNLKMDPFDSSLYIFCNKTKDKIKILHFEKTGFWIYYKRIETGRIKWPKNATENKITKQQLLWLLDGLFVTQKPLPECVSRHVI